MEFDAARVLWQIINFLILIGFIALVFLLPTRLFKRINAIESKLEQINSKLEALETNQKDINKLEG